MTLKELFYKVEMSGIVGIVAVLMFLSVFVAHPLAELSFSFSLFIVEFLVDLFYF